MEMDFSDRSILVIGASGGIGGATVRRLRQLGADVIAAGRNEATLARLAEETGCRTLAFALTARRRWRRRSAISTSGGW